MSKSIHNRGNPHAQTWVVCERPFPGDAAKGFLYSSPSGYVFDKMMHDAGIHDYYLTCRFNDLEDRYCATIVENDLNHYKPPTVITLGDTGKHFCPELRSKPKKGNEERAELDKYAGSLLTSSLLRYEHFILPTYGPDKIIQDWSLRDIVVSLDLGKVTSELFNLRRTGRLKPLPNPQLEYNLSFNETIAYLKFFETSKLLSVDIETVYPNKKSAYWPHPGYPITIGIANSSALGISFNLFWEDPEQNLMLWRQLDATLRGKSILGQNFYNFDFPRLVSLGYDIDLDMVQDTMIRHHVLWPELPHKLQFLTRQYTRQPYYKDEGHKWNLKDMSSLRRYNCLDVVVTYEVYEKQFEEFKERSYLL